MKSLNKIHLLSILILLSVISASAQTYTAPGSAGNVVLNGATETIGGSGTLTFTSLELKGNSTLTIPSGVRVEVNGPFINKAGSRVIVDGELILNGASSENKGGGVIEGSGTLYAPNGIDNKGGGTVFGSTDPNPSCTSGCSFTTLPVELLYFNVEFQEKVIITWATASEINNDYFSLERSENGKDFYEIARIEGNGNTEEKIVYSFEDNTYKAAVEYYRLKQVDYDGQFEYFKAARVETNIGEKSNEFKIFPTVINTGRATIQADQPFDIKTIQVYSLSGHSNGTYQPDFHENGSREVNLNINGLNNGLYLLKMVTNQGDEFTSRIIVQ